MIEPSIKADSIADLTGIRGTTFLFAVPTCKLAELRTHRIICQIDDVMGIGSGESFISLNSNSSRAIPVDRVAEACRANGFEPLWTKNQPGMNGEPLENSWDASWAWGEYFEEALRIYQHFKDLNIHKQDANLLFHPFAWSVVVATADQFGWEHFFKLRTAPDVYPAIRKVALQLEELYRSSTPQLLKQGEWHIPFADRGTVIEKLAVSGSCCARISYANEREESLEKHFSRARSCLAAGHVGIFEHQLLSPTELNLRDMEFVYGPHFEPRVGKYFSGIRGWVQCRKLIEAGDLTI